MIRCFIRLRIFKLRRFAVFSALLLPFIIYYSDGFLISPSSLLGARHRTDLVQPLHHAVLTKDASTLGEDEHEHEEDDDEILNNAIDSFLRGDYDQEFAEDSPAPHPDLSPGAVIESSLRWLRNLDEPEPAHGAAVFLRFCLPLSRGERWGDFFSSASPPALVVAKRRSGGDDDPWKKVLRGALTPSMFARRLRASEFSCLLDWRNLDVTEGAYGLQRDLVGVPTMAFVTAALYFGEGRGIEPVIIQFTLRRTGGVWLIDTAHKSASELFAGTTGL